MTRDATHEWKILRKAMRALINDHGVGSSELLHFVDKNMREIEDSNTALSERERKALCDSGKDGVIMEKLIVDGLVANADLNLSRHPTYTHVCYEKNYHTVDGSVCALRALNTVEKLRTIQGVIMKPWTAHGLGADAFWILSVSRSKKTIAFAVDELKCGKTCMHDAKYTEYSTSDNRSMRAIAAKLKTTAEGFQRALAETFPGYAVTYTKFVMSSSPWNDRALKRAAANNIEVWRHEELWDIVWTDEVKEYLKAQFGELAHELGIEKNKA